MSSLVIFDTSVFIDHLRADRHNERIAAVSGLVRISSDFELIREYRDVALEVW